LISKFKQVQSPHFDSLYREHPLGPPSMATLPEVSKGWPATSANDHVEGLAR
jgi:hypothetical protein